MTSCAENSVRPLVAHVRCVNGFGGGPEKTILNSPRFLAPLGYDSLCVYMRPPGDAGFATLEERAAAANAPLLALDDRGPLDWRLVRNLVRLCRERRVDIWHGHDYKSNVFGLIARRFWPMKLVTTLHGWVEDTRRMKLYNAIDRWAIRGYPEVMCVSQKLWEECLRFGVPAAHCRLIPNGIDTLDYRRTWSSDEAKLKCGATPGRLLLGAVGRLSPEKGFAQLIRAVDRVLSQGLDVDLWIAGQGGLRDELEQQITTRQRGERIRLVGQLKDPRAFFQACDLFVLSSLSEGLPNVVLEAMALETPVLATRVGEVPLVVTHEQDGILVEPDDEEALAREITRLAQDAELRRRLAFAARATVERSFSFGERIQREVAVYDLVLGRTAPSTPSIPSHQGAST